MQYALLFSIYSTIAILEADWQNAPHVWGMVWVIESVLMPRQGEQMFNSQTDQLLSWFPISTWRKQMLIGPFLLGSKVIYLYLGGVLPEGFPMQTESLLPLKLHSLAALAFWPVGKGGNVWDITWYFTSSHWHTASSSSSQRIVIGVLDCASRSPDISDNNYNILCDRSLIFYPASTYTMCYALLIWQITLGSTVKSLVCEHCFTNIMVKTS